jgi:hypothetical protein
MESPVSARGSSVVCLQRSRVKPGVELRRVLESPFSTPTMQSGGLRICEGVARVS